MPDFDADSHFMSEALKLAQQAEAEGEVPIGAVLVYQDQMIATGRNQCIGLCDPSAHAEIQALRAGAVALGNYRLLQTTLYVTLEPCCMCAGALVHARIGRLVFGASDPKAGALGSVFNILEDNRLNHRVSVQGDVLGTESRILLQSFFKKRRAHKSGENQNIYSPDQL